MGRWFNTGPVASSILPSSNRHCHCIRVPTAPSSGEELGLLKKNLSPRMRKKLLQGSPDPIGPYSQCSLVYAKFFRKAPSIFDLRLFVFLVILQNQCPVFRRKLLHAIVQSPGILTLFPPIRSASQRQIAVTALSTMPFCETRGEPFWLTAKK